MNQTTNPPSDRRCCNLEFLEVSLGRNRKTAIRLVGIFVDGYPELMHRLGKCLEECDLSCLGRVLHDIRGNCVLFSAQECLAQTIRMEGFLRGPSGGDGGSVDWSAEAALLRSALERLHGELSDYLANNGH